MPRKYRKAGAPTKRRLSGKTFTRATSHKTKTAAMKARRGKGPYTKTTTRVAPLKKDDPARKRGAKFGVYTTARRK